MVMKFTNNAASTLASGISSGATSLTVASGQGAKFPTLGAGDYFYCTLSSIAGGIEIVKVTERSTDTFTMVRGVDGTTAAAWTTGDKVELRLVAASLNDVPKLDEPNSFSARQSLAITPKVNTLASNAGSYALDTDAYDMVVITGQTATITSITTTGTPANGQKLWLSLTGTASVGFTLSSTYFEASTVALPTTTSGTARLDMGFVYNVASSKWRLVAQA
jgi:hypothetical protein